MPRSFLVVEEADRTMLAEAAVHRPVEGIVGHSFAEDRVDLVQKADILADRVAARSLGGHSLAEGVVVHSQAVIAGRSLAEMAVHIPVGRDWLRRVVDDPAVVVEKLADRIVGEVVHRIARPLRPYCHMMNQWPRSAF